MILQQLLDDIERFLAETGMSPAAFGTEALNDSRFVSRLREGRDVRVSTVEKVRRFMAERAPIRRRAA